LHLKILLLAKGYASQRRGNQMRQETMEAITEIKEPFKTAVLWFSHSCSHHE